MWIPVVAAALWLVFWRVKFAVLENAFGLDGLALIVFAVALWQLSPDWGSLWQQASGPTMPRAEGAATYLFYAVAIFGATMTPYEVFFFSSGGVEEKWSTKDLGTMRANVLLGFPLGAALSASIMATSTVVLLPMSVQADSLAQTVLPVAVGLGKLGVAVALLGFFAATFGAACETGLSVGYSVCQYFGWQWGKYVEPLRAARFHMVLLMCCIGGAGTLLTTVDPIMLTEYSVVFSALALPLTYIPILIVANDRTYMGEHANGRLANVLATVLLVPVLAASLAAIPLILLTKAGQ
ncbi:NRAMP family divalent metal transporter [Luteipulveratus halotolerans]|uniref:NRAMP family divalent metal transporter n=1 Tax=Luteipulveratus halotolerans TaxID=1631356 RepID=UPI002F41AE06